MEYPDIIWTGLATIGGFLLVRKKWIDLDCWEKRGILLIFFGFLAQVYWGILHKTATSKVVLNHTTISEVIGVTIIVLTPLLYMVIRDLKAKSRRRI